MDNPQHQDKAPPMKTAEEFLKEEVKSARNGIAVFLVIAFIFCRIVQIFSRRPGTSGAVMMVGSAFSLVPFIIFYDERVQETGTPDKIGPGVFIIAFFTLLVIDYAYAFYDSRKSARIPSRALGQGRLHWIFPGVRPALVGFVSDMAFCAMLMASLEAFDCPIQYEYFRIITAWVILTHLAMAMQHWWFTGRIRQTHKRATYYHKQVRNW